MLKSRREVYRLKALPQEGDGKRRSQAYLRLRRFTRNKAAVVSLFFILLLIFCAIFADRLTPYDYAKQSLVDRLQYPSSEHLMGTDDFGRDMLTRILRGGRVSLLVSLMSVSFSTIAALIIGAITGYFGGKIDNVIMRIIDIFLALPGLIFAMTISAALGSGLVNTAIALAVTSIAPLVRQLRSSILLIKNQEFIEASKAFGASHAKIIVKHVIPNTMAPLIVQIAMRLGDTIMAIAGLSFLGLGVQPPTPEWGNMLSAGQKYIQTFWPMMFWPGLAIALNMLAFNLLGDGVRDALDPRMKR
ncbi:MAG: ABC transporter permease [Oscillospiraceae bacterium]|jgi:peptide/nickel transport system permease protein